MLTLRRPRSTLAQARLGAWAAACVLAIVIRLVVMRRFGGTNDVLNFWDGHYPGMSWMLAWPRIGIVLGAITWVSFAGWSWRLARSVLLARDRRLAPAP